MDSKTRELSGAFLDGSSKQIGPVLLRGFTIGTLNACRVMGLSMFTEQTQAPVELSTEEKQRQAMAFAWAHSAPRGEVLDAIEDGTWPRKVKEFEFDLEIAALPDFIRAITYISKRASAAAVQISPRPGVKGDTEQPPGN